MKNYSVYAYDNQDNKLLVFTCPDLKACISIASALYENSDLEYSIIPEDGASAVIRFVKP